MAEDLFQRLAEIVEEVEEGGEPVEWRGSGAHDRLASEPGPRLTRVLPPDHAGRQRGPADVSGLGGA